MTFYLDTSVVAAYYSPEPLSTVAEDFIVTHTDLSISRLTELEFASAIARKIREGMLDKRDGSKIISKFMTHVDEDLYERIPINSRHYDLARDWMAGFVAPLRSLDALHLAVTSLSESTLVTADAKLAKSAELLSVDVIFLKT